MKYTNLILVDEDADQTQIVSSTVDFTQTMRMSAQIVVSSGTIDSSVQFQVSNDPMNARYLSSVEPTNWSNLGSAIPLTTDGIILVSSQEVCYGRLRVVIDNDNVMVNTVVAVADVAGSLNDTYFLISSMEDDYYVWFNVDGGGTDPVIPNRTGVEVAIAEDATANTVGGAIRTAFGALADFVVTGANATAILTNADPGSSEPAEDGAVPTGFTFTNNAPTAGITINLMALNA